MDRTAEQFKLMGVFGIYKETYKITCSWRKIFTQITLSLILPLSILYLSEIQISDLINDKITHNKNKLDTTQRGTPLYNRIQDRISSQWTIYWIIQSLYSLFLVIFSLLSTSAVVTAVGSIYSFNEAHFNKVIRVVPRVCKKLIVTALWSLFFIIILYSGVAIALGFGIAFASIGDGESPRRATIFHVLIGILALFYFIGLVYLLVIWNLASVISVLENVYGFKALKKSKNLIKGKFCVACAIFVKLQILFLGLLVAFTVLIVRGNSVGIGGKVFLGILFYWLLTILIHFLLVTQTIIYFVCKSYHNENIDRPGLPMHLEASYVHLNGNKDVQLGQVPA